MKWPTPEGDTSTPPGLGTQGRDAQSRGKPSPYILDDGGACPCSACLALVRRLTFKLMGSGLLVCRQDRQVSCLVRLPKFG